MSSNIMRSRAGKALLKAATIGLGVAVAAPAMAQNALDVVTVTARKQAESLNEVPVTVSAISGQNIERFNYDKVQDIESRIPTLNVQVGGSGSGAQVSLRGVGSSNISASFDSAIAFEFDGMVVSTMRILQSSFFDVQQIEVLKGPQSLYFGKSASGGVISIKSANPTDELEIGGKVAYELEERGMTYEAYISGPLSSKLGFRLAARYNDIDRIYLNSAPQADGTPQKRGQENLNIRATFEWEPTDNFTANLKVSYVGLEADGSIGNVVHDCGPNGVVDPVSYFGETVLVPGGYSCDTSGDVYFLAQGAPALFEGGSPLTGVGKGGNDGVPFSDSDIFFGTLTMDFDINDELTLTSVTGFLDQDAQDVDWFAYGGFCATEADCVFTGTTTTFAPGADNLSFGGGCACTDHQTEQFTQELRLQSSFEGPINFMFGFFYEERKISFSSSQYAVNIALLTGGDATQNGYTSDWLKRHFYDNEAISVFGSLTWEITDTLEFTGGLRWSHEEKTNVFMAPFVHSALVGPAFIPSGFTSPDIFFEDDNVSPEASLTWRATEDIIVYGAFKTGFKSGGIDNSALPSNNLLGLADPDPAVRQAVADGLIYQSETAEGGEIGVKATLADQTLQVNFSGFYYVFDDLQVQNFDAVAIQFQTGNASELTTKGFDLDVNWATPVEGLILFGSMAYTDAKYTADFDPNPNNALGLDVENLRGRAPGRAPKWSGNISLDYRMPLGNSFELGFSGAFTFSSSYFTNEDSLNDDIVQSSYQTVDLAVSLADQDGRWQVAVVGRNIGDERWISTSGPRPFLTAPGGLADTVLGVVPGDDQVLNLNRGRSIFLEASFKY